jgi:hypothetical protein
MPTLETSLGHQRQHLLLACAEHREWVVAPAGGHQFDLVSAVHETGVGPRRGSGGVI